jgi:hypothetical protein
MMVQYYESEFDIPDILIDKFAKDFDSLPGSGQYESKMQLRDSISDILEVIAEEPELLHEQEYLSDFIQALAMKKALERHGIMYDA